MVANETKTFGELVAEARRKNGLKQSDLAALVTKIHEPQVGGSTISRIETGGVPISMELGLSIIDALAPAPIQRRQLEQALDTYLDEFKLPAPYQSGKVLGEILEEIGLNNVELAAKIKKSHQLIQALRAGTKLMSDEVLMAIRQELSKAKVPASRLDDLARQHMVDVLTTMPRLTYLTKAQREKLTKCAARIL